MDGYQTMLVMLVTIVGIVAITLPACLKSKERNAGGGFTVRLRFAGGLNIFPNTMCKVFCGSEHISITACGQEFCLPNEKLVFVKKMRKTEITRQYVPNAGGAVAGAMIAGPLGALIGGGPSLKKVRMKSRYLVIAYQSEDGVQYILFDAAKNPSMVNKVRNRYRCLNSRPSIRVPL